MERSRIKLTLLGGATGLVLPWLFLWLYYKYNFSQIDFSLYIERLMVSSLFASMLSLVALVNLLSFFVFIWLNKDDAARGVLFSTFLYAFVVFGFRVLG